ncbi:hypothetical protein [Nostoc sp. DSM 114159]
MRTACWRQRLRQRQVKKYLTHAIDRAYPNSTLSVLVQAMPDLFALSIPTMKASGVRVEFGCTSNK